MRCERRGKRLALWLYSPGQAFAAPSSWGLRAGRNRQTASHKSRPLLHRLNNPAPVHPLIHPVHLRRSTKYWCLAPNPYQQGCANQMHRCVRLCHRGLLPVLPPFLFHCRALFQLHCCRSQPLYKSYLFSCW